MVNALLVFLETAFLFSVRFGMFIFFGFAAAGTWLFEFIKLDKLPEPAKMIVKIFFLGTLVTIPVFLAELGVAYGISKLSAPSLIIHILYWFVAIALIEEVFKYLVVRGSVLKSSEFDEPVDAMIYMIISAMGFAALENVLYLLPVSEKVLSLNTLFVSTATIAFFRFIGATFLHALCSGLIGYFLALSIYYKKNHLGILLAGIAIATFLHGLYNFSIMEAEGSIRIIIPAVILVGLAIFIFSAFKKLKKLKSICIT